MKTNEAVALLKRSVREFNAKMVKIIGHDHPSSVPFGIRSSVVLSDDEHFLDLSGMNLDGVDFRGACMDWIKLRGASMRKANFSGAFLEEADLRGANLEGANFFMARLQRAKLQEANLKNVKFGSTCLCSASLVGASMEGASVNDADLRHADFRGVDLSRVSDISDANWGGAMLDQGQKELILSQLQRSWDRLPQRRWDE